MHYLKFVTYEVSDPLYPDCWTVHKEDASMKRYFVPVVLNKCLNTLFTNLNIKKTVQSLLVTSLLLVTFGCGTKNVIRNSYSPRISPRDMVLEKSLKKIKEQRLYYVLNFQDRRGDIDPHLVWTKRQNEYRLSGKTLADYLYESFLFDLQRIGMNIVPANNTSILLSDIISKTQSAPENTEYIVSIDVYKCIPKDKIEWSTVRTFYIYDYHLKIWDNNRSKMVYDDHIAKSFEGASKGRVEFSDMVDELMNNYLKEMNFDVAEVLMEYTNIE